MNTFNDSYKIGLITPPDEQLPAVYVRKKLVQPRLFSYTVCVIGFVGNKSFGKFIKRILVSKRRENKRSS